MHFSKIAGIGAMPTADAGKVEPVENSIPVTCLMKKPALLQAFCVLHSVPCFIPQARSLNPCLGIKQRTGLFSLNLGNGFVNGFYRRIVV